MARRYGNHYQITPPEINLLNIPKRGVPIAMFTGGRDKLANPKQAQRAKDEIGYPETVFKFYYLRNFDHFSFTMFPHSSAYQVFMKTGIELVKQKNPLPVEPVAEKEPLKGKEDNEEDETEVKKE